MAEIEIPIADVEEAQDKVFSRRVALTTAGYAVLLAITALGGNNATKEMLLAQQQASDQWAFYQAKVLREHHYRIESLRLEAELAERGAVMPAPARERFEALRKKFSEEEKRYKDEKEVIKQQAEEHERDRNRNKDKDPNFDFAEALLQISIITASVAILSASRPLFYISTIFAALGGLLCLNGYLLVFRLPF